MKQKGNSGQIAPSGAHAEERSGGGIAVITGASSGIGREFAVRLAELGFDLVVTGRRPELLTQLKQHLENVTDRSVETVIGDLRERSTEDTILRLVASRPVELLVNNAGYSMPGEIQARSEADIIDQVEVQALLPLKLMRAALPGMTSRGSGTIINVGSLAGRLPVPRAAPYVASKIFLERISETVALEVWRFGVAVQALLPGYVTTDFHRDSPATLKRSSRGLVVWSRADEVVRASLAARERSLARIRAGKLPRPRDMVLIHGRLNRALAAIAPLIPRRLINYSVTRVRPE